MAIQRNVLQKNRVTTAMTWCIYAYKKKTLLEKQTNNIGILQPSAELNRRI